MKATRHQRGSDGDTPPVMRSTVGSRPRSRQVISPSTLAPSWTAARSRARNVRGSSMFTDAVRGLPMILPRSTPNNVAAVRLASSTRPCSSKEQ